MIGEPTVGAGGGREVGDAGAALPGSGFRVLVSGNFTIFDPSGSLTAGTWPEADLVGRITGADFQPRRDQPFAIQSIGVRPDVALATTLTDLRDGGVAGLRAAIDDPSFPTEQQDRLVAALRAAHVASELEIYPAKHGWVPSDTPVHDPAAAEKHWQTLEALFAKTLR